MPDTSVLIITGLVFLLAGCTKGIVGFGLPLVGVGLLTAIFGLPTAMALLLIPALTTNLWQGFGGKDTIILLKRFWPFFVATMIFTYPGTLALSRGNVNYLTALLGALLMSYSIFSLNRSQFAVPAHLEKGLNPILGMISGILAGLTGVFTVPGVVYLQSTQMPRDQLVQAMGILFTLSTIGLTASLGAQSILTPKLALLSLAGLVPTIIGMLVGTWIRKRISEKTFKSIFLVALGALGLYIFMRSVIALMN